MDCLEDFTNFRKRVTIFCHDFAIIQGIFYLKISLAKYRSATRLWKFRDFYLPLLFILRLWSLQSKLFVEDIFFIEKIDSINLLIKLISIELNYSFKDFNNVSLLLEVIMLDISYKHAYHGISIKPTWNIIKITLVSDVEVHLSQIILYYYHNRVQRFYWLQPVVNLVCRYYPQMVALLLLIHSLNCQIDVDFARW